MEIETQRGGDVLVVTIAGEMDANNCGDLAKAVEPDLGPELERIEIDAAELTFIDSSGISALIELHEKMSERGGSVVVVEPTTPVRRVLEITGLAEAFQL